MDWRQSDGVKRTGICPKLEYADGSYKSPLGHLRRERRSRRRDVRKPKAKDTQK